MLVKRYLTNPVTHEVDSAQSPVATMSHHVLHVMREQRVPVLVDLTSAPGRTLVFTRTKHGAKTLARQLNKTGVPAVDLHGNLSQNARTRNLAAFDAGRATPWSRPTSPPAASTSTTSPSSMHADPPTEHKAYLHRSGRTARAGAAGTVVTLDDRRAGARRARPDAQAGIKPTTTGPWPRTRAARELAPGERSLPGGLVVEDAHLSVAAVARPGANAQRKRGPQRRPDQRPVAAPGNPTSYSSETPSGSSTGGRSASSLRWRPGGRSGR